jgi:DNA-binding MarR family transcriptional regulator
VRPSLGADLVHLLLEVTFAQRERLDAAARAQGLTTAGALLLLHLDSPAPMRQLARTLRCDASNITGLVDRLAMHGLVERVEDADDRRVRRVALTERGRTVRADLDSGLVGSEPGLDALDDDEQRTLADLLTRVAETYRG